MSASASSDQINILLVDDRRENLAVLRAVLDDPTYNLIQATSGSEALGAVLKVEDLALILLDVFMGGLDGYEVASLIKAREKTRHIPIIFLTAMAKDVDHIFKAYSIGAVDYIHKPLEPHIVRAKVSVFAELYRNKQEIKRQAELIRMSELREKDYQLQQVRLAGERRFQDLVEGINHGFVWSADPQSFTFSYVSPRATVILGYRPEQWFHERGFWENHLHPDDREAVLGAFRAAQMGRDIGIDHRFLREDGDTVWLHTGVRLARRGEGVGYELRGLSVDITHLKEIESALREAVRVRDEFLSIASHELRTPLTPLKLQVQSLARAIDKGDPTALSRERITKLLLMWSRQLDRLGKLIEDLLDVSRITAGRMVISREKIDLVQTVKDLVDRYCEEIAAANCDLQISAPKALMGSWDKLRIEQVVINLITNALKYGAGKPIRIHIESHQDKVTLSIRDFGIGINPEGQKKIFERFERAVSPSSFGGLGLGLYISRSIVEAHGGSIRVESEPQRGSTFIVELPLEDPSITAASYESA